MSLRSIKQYLLDNTMSLASVAPIQASFETLLLGMPSDVSIKSRFVGAGISYIGIGWLYVNGRDVSLKYFGIDPKIKGWKRGLHDFLYAAAFSAIVSPGMYLLSGSNMEDAVNGTGTMIALSLPCGIVSGYAIDAGRELHGLLPPKEQPTERLPQAIRSLPKSAKYGLYATALASLIGLSALVYSFAPKKSYEHAQPTNLEQRIDQYSPAK